MVTWASSLGENLLIEHFHQVLYLCTFLCAYSTSIKSFKNRQKINLMQHMDPDSNKRSFLKPFSQLRKSDI